MNGNLCRIGLAALALYLLPVAVSAETRVLQYEGKRARAYFETLDSSGCIGTWTDVYIFESESRTLPLPVEASRWLIVFMGRNDHCQSVALNLVYGSILLSEDDYSFNGMHSAQLSKSLDASDFIAGVTVPLTVDLTWVGQGNADQARERHHSTSPELKWMFHSRGIMRDAVATGSVLVGTEMVTPGPSTEADLSTSAQSNLYISH